MFYECYQNKIKTRILFMHEIFITNNVIPPSQMYPPLSFRTDMAFHKYVASINCSPNTWCMQIGYLYINFQFAVSSRRFARLMANVCNSMKSMEINGRSYFYLPGELSEIYLRILRGSLFYVLCLLVVELFF